MAKADKSTSMPEDRPVSHLDVRSEALHKVKAAINPLDAIEDLYADDFAQMNLFNKALGRALWTQIDSKVPDELHERLLVDHASGDECSLVKLIDRSSTGDPLSKAAIAMLLKKRGIREEDIRAGAMLRSLPNIQIIDQLQTAASTRRDKALAAIMAWRQHKRQHGIPDQASASLGYPADKTQEARDDE